MSKLPVIKGRELVKFLESIDFKVIRTKGFHVRLRSEDGRVTTVPIHENKDIPIIFINFSVISCFYIQIKLIIFL